MRLGIYDSRRHILTNEKVEAAEKELVIYRFFLFLYIINIMQIISYITKPILKITKLILSCLKPILEFSFVYNFYQKLIGDTRLRKKYSKKYLRCKDGYKILDIGCGPANMVKYLPKNITYVGTDKSEEYINFARKKYNDPNLEFINIPVTSLHMKKNYFDIVMANAILMSLNDFEADILFSLAYQSLKNGGRLVIYDGYYHDNLSVIKKILITNERGNFLRTNEDYYKLASKYFSNICITTNDNMYRIPYPMIIIECTK